MSGVALSVVTEGGFMSINIELLLLSAYFHKPNRRQQRLPFPAQMLL